MVENDKVDSTVVECVNCGRKNRVRAAASGVPRCGNCQSPLPWIASADDDTYAAVIDSSSLPVLVDLWAPWCGPCRTISPALESLARSHAGKVKLVKINVDESPRTASRFNVQSIPTLLVIDHGEVADRQIGALPEQRLGTWLDAALSKLWSSSATSGSAGSASNPPSDG